jgi:hypothetical protein
MEDMAAVFLSSSKSVQVKRGKEERGKRKESAPIQANSNSQDAGRFCEKKNPPLSNFLAGRRR